MSWAYVQGGVGGHNATAGASVVLSFGSNVVAGDQIMVAVVTTMAVTGLTVADSQLNVYTADETESTTGLLAAIYRAKVATSGALTVTISVTSSVFVSGCIDEFRPSGTNSLDGTAGGIGTSTSPSSGTCPVTGTSDLVYGVVGTESTATGAGAPFTTTYNLAFVAGNHYGISAQYALGQSAAIAATWTIPSALWSAAAASYIGGGGFVPYHMLFRGSIAGLLDTP